LTGIADWLTAWDRAAFQAVNGGMSSPVLDRIMPIVTDMGLGHVQFIAIVLAGLALAAFRDRATGVPFWVVLAEAVPRRWRWMGPMLAALLATGLLVHIPKRIPRQRPSWFYHHQHAAGRMLDVGVHTIAGRRPLRVQGFPSGHTATTAAIALAMSLRLPRRPGRGAALIAAWLCVGLIGLSRVYMADHWPLDVVGGAIFGAVTGAGVVLIWRAFERKRVAA